MLIFAAIAQVTQFIRNLNCGPIAVTKKAHCAEKVLDKFEKTSSK